MTIRLIFLLAISVITYHIFFNNEKNIEPAVNPPSGQLKKLTITFYSTSWCPYCKAAREYMKSHHIPFKEYDIEKSALGKVKHDRLMKEYGKSTKIGVPLFDINDKIVLGYSKASFEREIYDATH